jgi:hypothetical protein
VIRLPTPNYFGAFMLLDSLSITIWVAYRAVMAGLGVYVSLTFGDVFVVAIFIAMFLFCAVRTVPYSRLWKWSAEQTNRGGAAKKTRLRIDEEGLHETVDGLVESFAPWSAFRSFSVVDERRHP